MKLDPSQLRAVALLATDAQYAAWSLAADREGMPLAVWIRHALDATVGLVEGARPRWKVDPDEVPPELRDNFLVRYLVGLTPEQEAAIERTEMLDAQPESARE